MLKPNKTLAAALAALFPNSEKAVSEKLTQEEFNAFAEEAQEVQTRLDAQTTGNQAVADDLTAANASLATAQAELATAQATLATTATELATAQAALATAQAKATQWDAYKASLTGAVLESDSTNGKPNAGQTDLSAADQNRNDRLRSLKAKHPMLMADVDVADDES